MSGGRTIWALGSLLCLAACERAATTARMEVSASTGSSTPTALPPTVHDTVDAMDSRKPVPLLPKMAHHQKQNMRDHLLVVQEVSMALASDDFEAAERAVRRIASSTRMTQMCEHMGSLAPGFTELALGFHRTADTLLEATQKRDEDAVLAALGQTLHACTSCHATYKQQVVDEATWASLATPHSAGPR